MKTSLGCVPERTISVPCTDAVIFDDVEYDPVHETAWACSSAQSRCVPEKRSRRGIALMRLVHSREYAAMWLDRLLARWSPVVSDSWHSFRGDDCGIRPGCALGMVVCVGGT